MKISSREGTAISNALSWMPCETSVFRMSCGLTPGWGSSFNHGVQPFNLLHSRDCRGQCPAGVDVHIVGREAFIDFLQTAVKQHFALVDQHDLVAELFHLVHLMGAHDDSFAGVALLLEDVFDQLGVERSSALKVRR